MAAEQAAEDRTAGHGGASRDGDRQRLVGGAQTVGVLDRDHAPAGEHAGVDDNSGAGGEHRVAGRPAEVDAAVTRTVGRGRRVEAAQDRRSAGQRPLPGADARPGGRRTWARGVVDGADARTGRARHGEREDQHQHDPPAEVDGRRRGRRAVGGGPARGWDGGGLGGGAAAHARTLVPARRAGQGSAGICGQNRGLWTAGWQRRSRPPYTAGASRSGGSTSRVLLPRAGRWRPSSVPPASPESTARSRHRTPGRRPPGRRDNRGRAGSPAQQGRAATARRRRRDAWPSSP